LPLTLPSDLVEQRPDIRAAERLLAARNAQIGVEAAHRFPQVSLLGLIGIGGIGRFYIGDIGIGVAQLLVGWLTCGIGLIWSIVDAILILTDKVPDPQGRPLRDGT